MYLCFQLFPTQCFVFVSGVKCEKNSVFNFGQYIPGAFPVELAKQKQSDLSSNVKLEPHSNNMSSSSNLYQHEKYTIIIDKCENQSLGNLI